MGFVGSIHLSGFFVSLYSLFFFTIGARFFSLLKKPSTMLMVFLALLNGVFCVFILSRNTKISDVYLIAIVTLTIECVLAFRGDKGVQVLAALHTGLHLVTIRSFSICIVSMASPAPIVDIITTQKYRFQSFLIAVVIIFACLIANIIMFSPEKLKYTFRNKRQLKLVCGSAILLCLYQILSTKAFYYTIEIPWFSVLQLISSIIILLVYYFVLLCSTRVSEWVNTAMLNAQLEQSLRLQLSHYEAYARSEQAIKIFKHDYKSLVLTVSSLLVNDQPQQALAVLEQMDHKLQQDVLVHRVYSSNVHINAALQELANECLAQSITFNAGVVIPDVFEAYRIEFSAIFAALSKLALDCCKEMTGNKSIDIFTNTAGCWLTIAMEFSCPDIAVATKARARIDNSLEKLAAKRFIEKNSGFTETNCVNGIAKTHIHLNIPLKEGTAL